MEEIKQLVYNYAKAIHTQNEKDFKALWSSKENTLISLTNQFDGIDSIYNDFLIGVIQRIYEQRRVRASELAGINTVPAFVLPLDRDQIGRAHV